MAIAVSDAAANAIALAIENQTKVMVAQNLALNGFLSANFSPAGSTLPSSPVAIARVQAQTLNDIHLVMTNMLSQQQLLIASVDVLQTGLAGISSQVASGVTTNQLAVADQIKANKFQQQTTNASLKRADLPETEVSDESFLESTKKIVDDTLTFKSQIGISTLVEEQITSAISWTSTTVGNFISTSFIGDAVRDSAVIQRIKKFFIATKEKEQEAAKTISQAAADTRAKLLVDVKPPIPAGNLTP